MLVVFVLYPKFDLAFHNHDLELQFLKPQLFEDFSLHGKVAVAVSKSVNLFAKGGYDVNRAQKAGAAYIYDRYVLPGVELGFYGAGVEYFPIKEAKQALRLHAFWCSNTSEPVQQTFNIGLRWQMDLLSR